MRRYLDRNRHMLQRQMSGELLRPRSNDDDLPLTQRHLVCLWYLPIDVPRQAGEGRRKPALW
ncbi:hypothetical protein L798_09358 [Zootermopsis nevadensis]|uniref:Uncharacterized protein n=1 Tax=Zootermopsis nevadensis TaxID=136037 RepID=A0A067R1L2_ZOONE|nr:hypothetical protein L798_09358 [Zootermopsis nevadensis]